MNLVLVGVSHRTAPVEVRERVAFPSAELPASLARAASLAGDSAGRGEAMILSTCNRVEIYLSFRQELGQELGQAFGPRLGPQPESGRAEGGARGIPPAHPRHLVAAFLAETRSIDVRQLEPHLYTESGESAVRHLFRVASSLDSVVVGEPQILGQVKDAFEAAQHAGTVGGLLGQVVPRAFGAARRVRSETEIARSSASVASTAVDLSRRIFGDLVGREVLVIGAGEMGELAARHLVSSGCGKLHVVNRTRARGDELVGRLTAAGQPPGSGAEAHGWDALPQLLVRADVVVCSTGAPEPVLSREVVKQAMKARKGRWLCLLDIAVPRDVEPEAGEIDNVYLYDVDALTQIVDEHLEGRRREAEAAERIVAEEVGRCREVFRSRGVVPTIRALRERFTQVARAETDRALARLGPVGDKERKAIEMLAEGIVNKLLHQPLTVIKREAESEEMMSAVRRLFELPDVSDPAEAAGDQPTSASASHGPGAPVQAIGTDEKRR